jgi:O-glycosyl hydrolase
MKQPSVPAHPVLVFKRIVQCLLLLAILLFTAFALTACDNGNNTTPKEEPTPEPTSTPTATLTPTPAGPEIDPDARQLTLDLAGTHQTIDGFGAGFTWYADMIFQRQHYEEVFDLLFKDAGFTILRFKNEYGYSTFNASVLTNKRYYEAAKKRAAERGEDVTVLYSSWSPAASLKSNGTIYGFGTLKRDENGNYVYDDFAAWWKESVDAYQKYGIPVDYVSIQNECDYQASYDGCEFGKEESDTLASYASAFLATYRLFRDSYGADAPLMVAPETMTVAPTDLRGYLRPIIAEEPDSVAVIGHHLYLGGESSDDPNTCNYDSFLMNFRSVASLAKEYNARKWQTEFYRGTALETANVINNSLIHENVNAYIFWGGVWTGSAVDGIDCGNLIICGTRFKDGASEKGYMVTGDYYAMRHYSEFIRPGNIRIDASLTSASGVRLSAYRSEDGSKVVIVLLNNNADSAKVQLPLENYDLTGSKCFQSVFTAGYTADMLYRDLGALDTNRIVELPGESVTTIVLEGSSK